VPTPGDAWAGAQHWGIAAGADGTLYAAPGGQPVVGRLKPGGAWELRDVGQDQLKRIAAMPDGRVVFSTIYGREVFRYDFAAGGAAEKIAGTGEKGYDGDGGPAVAARFQACSGVSVAPDGRILVCDGHAGTVRAIGPDGILRAIAGASGARVEGDAFEVAINAPLAVTLDPAGRLVVTETAGHSVKRVEDGQLAILAGGGSDRGASPVAARELYLDHPGGVTYAGDTLYFMDTVNSVVRRLRPDGTADIVAGLLDKRSIFNTVDVASGPALEMAFARPSAVVVGPDGAIYFADSYNNVVMRVADGIASIHAGQPSVGGKPAAGLAAEGAIAKESPLKAPCGLAFDGAGNLFVAEAGNYRIAKIDPQGRITTHAGATMEAALPRLGAGGALVRTGDRLTEGFLAGPIGLAFGPTGDLFVTVLGTTNLQLLGDFLPLATDVPVTVPPSVLKLGTDGRITVLAGPGGLVLSDPDAEDALALPFGVVVDPQGRVVVADAGQNQVRAFPAGDR
jgi:sugar lactone lactonase YvrE